MRHYIDASKETQIKSQQPDATVTVKTLTVLLLTRAEIKSDAIVGNKAMNANKKRSIRLLVAVEVSMALSKIELKEK